MVEALAVGIGEKVRVCVTDIETVGVIEIDMGGVRVLLTDAVTAGVNVRVPGGVAVPGADTEGFDDGAVPLVGDQLDETVAVGVTTDEPELVGTLVTVRDCDTGADALRDAVAATDTEVL